jgi:hypothetical protein
MVCSWRLAISLAQSDARTCNSIAVAADNAATPAGAYAVIAGGISL